MAHTDMSSPTITRSKALEYARKWGEMHGSVQAFATTGVIQDAAQLDRVKAEIKRDIHWAVERWEDLGVKVPIPKTFLVEIAELFVYVSETPLDQLDHLTHF